MDSNEYQRLAARTLIDVPDKEYTDGEIMLVWNAIGLAGEAGEVADTIKKAVFHQHGLNQTELIKELGDVLWYFGTLPRFAQSLALIWKQSCGETLKSCSLDIRMDIRRQTVSKGLKTRRAIWIAG